MDPERWQKLEKLFHAAAERLPEERADWLEEQCPDDDLRREVLDLLAAEEPGGEAVERAVVGVLDLALEAGEGPERTRIGPYRILRELGRGGLSTVYLAERDDAEYRARVAIKLVKRGMDTRDILRRLRRERQILATLDHPYIARLFDGGSTEDGLPYFVMEAIEGQTLDAWCDDRQLPLRERLELFCKVCEAVQYAHQNLVVHRDIKPGNLMVTDGGTPKLLDFGIAKLLEPGQATHPTATAAGLRLLTPQFASPEQIRGEPLTTATDIYSLGVLLYLLLTGRSPLPPGLSGRAVEHAVCEVPAPRPSQEVLRGPENEADAAARARGTRSERLSRRLRGDLDNIVLMALRKEPRRRYASAQQLGDDLQRYLEAMPVRARPDTFRYRAGKFVRRHRYGVVAACLLFTSLSAGIVTTTWQARRAEAAQARAESNLELAERQRAKAERVSGFLVNLFEQNDPGESKGDDITAREILDRGARRILLELSGEQELMAEMMDVMGTVYQKLGDYPEAETLLRRALEERRALYGEEHPEVAASLRNLAFLEMTRNDFESAEAHYRQALALRRRLQPFEPAPTGEILNDLAVLHLSHEDFTVAEELFHEALDLRRTHLDTDHPDIAETLNNLAALHYHRGELAIAEELMRESLTLRRSHYGDLHPRVATSLNNLAALLQSQSRFEEAEPLVREVLAMRRRMLGEDHPDVAVSLNNLGALLREQSRLEEAVPALKSALEITRKALGERHLNVSGIQLNLAQVYHRQGTLDEAQALFLDSYTLRRELLGDDHPRTAFPLLGLGRSRLEAGDVAGAEGPLRSALALLESSQGDGSEVLAEARGALGEVLLETGALAEAERLLHAAQEVWDGKAATHPERQLNESRLRRLAAAL